MSSVSFVFTNAFLPIPADDRFINTQELLKEIREAKNVYFVPKTLNRRVVEEIIKQFDIGMIPYDVSFDFNKYCYPMKLFEYFYMGLPVISAPIEELKRFTKFVRIGDTVQEWEHQIKTLLSKPWPKSYKIKQREIARENSWEKKINTVTSLVDW